jgi:hypothetical protein
MKNLTIILLILLCCGCSKDLESLNKDTKNATSASSESFVNAAIKNLGDVMFSITYQPSGTYQISRIWAQQISSVTYNEGATFFTNFTWNSVYMSVLKNLDEGSKIAAATTPVGASGPAIQKNQLAVIEILNVYTYSTLVEAFGNIPYTEALDFNNVSAKYDDAQTVYADLIRRLNTAINNLDPTVTGYSSDLIYNGNITRWKKFGNSLKLKMGMRIIDKDAVLGAATVIAAAPGVITANADNAVLKYLSSPPNTNPLWTSLAVGNRKDYVGGKPFVDLMNTLNDPRRPIFFKPVNGAYIGSPSGAVVTYELFSPFGAAFFEPTLPGIFLDYSTVEFLLAEAAERALIGSPATAESHYNAAIRASFDYYGVGSGATAYLAQPGVAYTTATGTWKQKIGTQKWLALFNQGFEAWTEYRRLDYPVLSAPPGSFIPTVAVRLTYPIVEQTINSASYKSAVAAMGGDLMTIKLFWDVY